MPNLRINNSIPNMGIRNSVPNNRISTFKTPGNYTISQGTPIGLLLSLTYSQTITPTFGDFRPKMWIKNN